MKGYPYLDTMNQEKENPNFKLMHLRLLLNGSEAEITESGIQRWLQERKRGEREVGEKMEFSKRESDFTTDKYHSEHIVWQGRRQERRQERNQQEGRQEEGGHDSTCISRSSAHLGSHPSQTNISTLLKSLESLSILSNLFRISLDSLEFLAFL